MSWDWKGLKNGLWQDILPLLHANQWEKIKVDLNSKHRRRQAVKSIHAREWLLAMVLTQPNLTLTPRTAVLQVSFGCWRFLWVKGTFASLSQSKQQKQLWVKSDLCQDYTCTSKNESGTGELGLGRGTGFNTCCFHWTRPYLSPMQPVCNPSPPHSTLPPLCFTLASGLPAPYDLFRSAQVHRKALFFSLVRWQLEIFWLLFSS